MMFDSFRLHVCQQFALRPTLQSLGISQTQVDQQYQDVLEHYAEQLIRFFAGPPAHRGGPWRQLAQSLAQRLRVARRSLAQASLRAMVDTVLDYPDSGARDKRLGERSPQVYVTTRYGCLALVISRDGDTPLVFTVSHGLEAFDDVPALADAERLEHNVFEGWALAALDQALLRVARVDPSRFPVLDDLDRQLMWASQLSGFVQTGRPQDNLRQELEQQLPSWLKGASPAWRLAYSQWLETMARFHEKSEGVGTRGPELDVETEAGAAAQVIFARQLALNLRRLTLECCLQGRCNVTYEGYRVMRAAVKVYKNQRRLRGVAMTFRPLAQGSGYLVGSSTGTPGPWLVVRPEASEVIEQVETAPQVRASLIDPFMTFYRAGITRWLPLLEHPLHTLARLKQVGGNLEGDCEATPTWKCETHLLHNLALLLVCTGAESPVDALDTLPRVKRMDSDWAGASGDLSVVQDRRLQALRRPSSALGQLIQSGVHKGLHLLDDAVVYNKDENHFNVLSNNRVSLNINIIEHQLVDTAQQPTQFGPHVAPDARDHWQLQRTPRVRRDLARLNSAVRAGNTLSATAPALLRDASRQAQTPGALPVDVEERLERSARSFEAAALNIRASGGNDPQVDVLYSQARQLRDYGSALRMDMTRHTTRPTVGDMVYLLEQNAIRIRRLNGRVKETIDGREDYLQEYEVQDLTDASKPLWYAHFHYPTLQMADDQPTKAHLKTAAQRRLGRVFEQSERAAGRSTQVYRGPITNAAGRELFLKVKSPT